MKKSHSHLTSIRNLGRSRDHDKLPRRPFQSSPSATYDEAGRSGAGQRAGHGRAIQSLLSSDHQSSPSSLTQSHSPITQSNFRIFQCPHHLPCSLDATTHEIESANIHYLYQQPPQDQHYVTHSPLPFQTSPN
jgi:hypothetical protein